MALSIIDCDKDGLYPVETSIPLPAAASCTMKQQQPESIWTLTATYESACMTTTTRTMSKPRRVFFLQSQLLQNWSGYQQLPHLPKDSLHHLQVT